VIKLIALLVALSVVAGACGGDESGSATAEEPSAAGQVPFDMAFIDAMIPHHREAIAMADVATARGLSQPDLQEMANDIAVSQQAEIDQMLQWRESWFGSRTLGPLRPEVLGVPEDELGMDHGSADELEAASDVDATFAQLMIPHHEGAISMAEVASEQAQHSEIRDLASRIIDAQEREITIMEMHAAGEHHG
jgi:uncharacterized protein (DUF305 family)